MDPKDVVENMLEKMGFSTFEVENIHEDDTNKLNITLPEADSGMLIGYRGEKINALQLLVNIMCNSDDEYSPIRVDVNAYRQARTTQIEEIAQKAADKAMQSGKEIVIPPMNAYERRIVHMYLSKNASVETYSEGEGSGRRVIVSPSEEA